MSRNRKLLIALIVVLIIAAIAAALWSRKQKAAQNKTAAETTLDKTDAPKAQIIDGFPKELILDPKASVDQSYKINYATQMQYTVVYKSSLSPKEVHDAYSAYLTKNNYRILSEKVSDPISAIYGSNATADINLTATKGPTGPTNVVISYLKK